MFVTNATVLYATHFKISDGLGIFITQADILGTVSSIHVFAFL